jgi:hypothetical protein
MYAMLGATEVVHHHYRRHHHHPHHRCRRRVRMTRTTTPSMSLTTRQGEVPLIELQAAIVASFET